jgi:hypothetical protein
MYLVTRQTLADRPAAHILALGAAAADALGTGVGTAARTAVGAAHVAAAAGAYCPLATPRGLRNILSLVCVSAPSLFCLLKGTVPGVYNCMKMVRIDKPWLGHTVLNIYMCVCEVWRVCMCV